MKHARSESAAMQLACPLCASNAVIAHTVGRPSGRRRAAATERAAISCVACGSVCPRETGVA